MFSPLNQCREAYVSPYVPPPTGYLVVEGFISGSSPVTYQLSRVAKLSSDTTTINELNASVQIEGNDNSQYPLAELGNGMYGSSAMLPLNPSVQYRLRITTSAGRIYLSDYVPYKVTPAIDSINWIENASGVTLYANTHDDAAATKYYQWVYDETWEYHSAEESHFKWINSTAMIASRDSTEEIYSCWHMESSTRVLNFSTEKLSHDVVYEFPLRQIPINTAPLNVLYSILVRQYALTKPGYEFLNTVKQNTESLGSIFDAQPSELQGNIHSLTDPAEPVIGFISAGTVSQQRIFIYKVELPAWAYSYSCPQADTLVSQPDLLKFFGNGYIPIRDSRDPTSPSGYFGNFSFCIDCRSQGGTTTKPSFWPN
jgi:hypothetical protein